MHWISLGLQWIPSGEVQSMIRSKGKAKVFDEKAVLGGICRHESPTVGFMNTKAGEKYESSFFFFSQIICCFDFFLKQPKTEQVTTSSAYGRYW